MLKFFYRVELQKWRVSLRPKNGLTVTFAALESRRLCRGGRWDWLDVDVRERRLEIEVVVLLNVGTDLLGLGHQDGRDAGELALVFPEVLLEVAGVCARAGNVPRWELVYIWSSDNNSVTYRVQGLWPDFWRSTTYYKCELQFKDNCNYKLQRLINLCRWEHLLSDWNICKMMRFPYASSRLSLHHCKAMSFQNYIF